MQQNLLSTIHTLMHNSSLINNQIQRLNAFITFHFANGNSAQYPSQQPSIPQQQEILNNYHPRQYPPSASSSSSSAISSSSRADLEIQTATFTLFKQILENIPETTTDKTVTDNIKFLKKLADKLSQKEMSYSSSSQPTLKDIIGYQKIKRQDLVTVYNNILTAENQQPPPHPETFKNLQLIITILQLLGNSNSVPESSQEFFKSLLLCFNKPINEVKEKLVSLNEQLQAARTREGAADLLNFNGESSSIPSAAQSSISASTSSPGNNNAGKRKRK